MSNYSPATNFGSKDALAHGQPAKAVLGAELTTEFTAIGTMSATKEDLANKGAVNGYASLDGSGFVPLAQLTGVAKLASSNIFTGAIQTIQAATVDFTLWSTAAGFDAKRWTLRQSSSGTLELFTQTDAGAGATDAIAITRSGTAPNVFAITATTLTFNGVDMRSASLINSGTFAEARLGSGGGTSAKFLRGDMTWQATLSDSMVAQSSVTQHQAALTIAETQITDGSLLARVGGTETISGTWTISGAMTYSTRPKFTSAGGFLSHNNASNTGGAIIVTNVVPSDTSGMNAGDIKLVY